MSPGTHMAGKVDMAEYGIHGEWHIGQPTDMEFS